MMQGQNLIENFNSLPDVARVSVPVFCVLASISKPTYYRRARLKAVPHGDMMGGHRKIQVGEVREYLTDPEGWAERHAADASSYEVG